MLSCADATMEPGGAENLPKTHNELPVHWRWVKVAKAGTYIHPTKRDATGKNIVFPITLSRMDRWIDTIRKARGRGVELPIVKDHKKTSDNSIGEFVDAKRVGDELYYHAGFYGDDALDIARRNKYSIGLLPSILPDGRKHPKRFVDSFGNDDYGEMPDHLATTPIPVMHGATGFSAMTFSYASEQEH